MKLLLVCVTFHCLKDEVWWGLICREHKVFYYSPETLLIALPGENKMLLYPTRCLVGLPQFISDWCFSVGSTSFKADPFLRFTMRRFGVPNFSSLRLRLSLEARPAHISSSPP